MTIKNFFYKHFILNIDSIKLDFIKNILLPEIGFLIIALLSDFIIRNKFLKKIKLSNNFLFKDLQIFCLYFLLRSILILIFSFLFSIVTSHQSIFLNQIATSILIFGFFKFLSLIAENDNINKLGIFITIVSFIYSINPVKITTVLTEVKFETVLFQINLFILMLIIVKLSIFYAIASVNSKVLDFVLPKISKKLHTIKILKIICTYIVYASLILSLSSGIGIKSSHLAMIGSAIGIGIGFGLQRLAANFISGVIIMSENKFKIGDTIILSDDTWGTILEIDTRTTIILTFNQEKMIIPNEIILNSIIKNVTLDDTKYSIRIAFKVKFNSNLTKVVEIVQIIYNDFVMKNYILKIPHVRVGDIFNEGIEVYVRFYFKDVNASGDFNPWEVKSKFLLRLQEEFLLNNIEFANVYIKSSC